MRESKRLCAALFLIILSGCASYQVSDIGPMVQLPASKECFQVFTLSKREVSYPAPKCEEIKKRSILLTSETWKILRLDVQRNCQLAQCKQITGAVDEMFLALDQALQKLQKK